MAVSGGGDYLFSCRVVGWSAQPRITTDLALQALLAAVWRRKLTTRVTIHSDQGSQFTSREWQMFFGQHNPEASMSRRGNCHDNAVAESFNQLLKRERISLAPLLRPQAGRRALRLDRILVTRIAFVPRSGRVSVDDARQVA